MLLASREQIREAGRFADYEALLSAQARAELESVLVGSWQPLALAEEHYAAIDRLNLSDSQVATLTSSAAEKLHGIFLSTLSKMVRSSGITPWSVAPMSGKIWSRLFVGGALAIRQAGPTDARVVLAGFPLVRSRYLRLGIAQHLATAIRFVVARRPSVRPQALDLEGGRAEYLLHWR